MRRIYLFFKRYFSRTYSILCCFYIHLRFGMVYFYYNVDDDKFISLIKNSIQ